MTVSTLREHAIADVVLIASRLLGPPDESKREAAIVPDALDALAREADPSRADRLSGGVRRALDAARREDLEAWRGEHTRLFDGGVACPINETAYVRRDKGVIIADICGFYRAFGFAPATDSGEKPDHLVCELEFTAMLALMLAAARADGRDEEAQITTEALGSFLDDHLAEWIALFAERLASTARLPVHGAIADLLPIVWDTVASAVGAPSFDDLAAREAPPENTEPHTPYECGMDAEAETEPAAVPLTGPPGSGLPGLEDETTPS